MGLKYTQIHVIAVQDVISLIFLSILGLASVLPFFKMTDLAFSFGAATSVIQKHYVTIT